MIVKNERDVKAEKIIEEGAENVTIQWLVDGKLGAPNFAMRRFVIGKDGHTPLHKHDWEHEVFVLSGRGTLINGNGKEMPLSEGNFAFVSPNEVHQFKNAGDADFVFLCIIPIK
ncbi:MAG: cupin domain-containing protein [Candidatus Thermoplasmatota archaeon]|nr:cupin domain-containing protein [Candidatus Thermoplasmatota archaeon]